MDASKPMAWTWPSIAVDNSPKCGFIALIPTPRLPPPTSESPCSASDNNIGLGNFRGAWPSPAQLSSFHPRLFRGEDVPVMWAGAAQGQGIQVAPTHCKLPQWPASDQTHVWSLSVWLNHCWEMQSPLLILENIIVCSMIHFLHNSALIFFMKIFHFSIALWSLTSYLVPHILKILYWSKIHHEKKRTPALILK